MSEWREATIDELAIRVSGGPFGSSLGRKDYQTSGVPVIRGAQLSGSSRFSFDDLVYVSEEKANKHGANLAYPGDIIVTQRGTLGQVGLVPSHSSHDRYLLSQSQMAIKVNPERANAEFLLFILLSPEYQRRLVSVGTSAGVPHINLTALRELVVQAPPLSSQQRIAAVLSAFDELIEINERRIELLEHLARSLYREWFVHFRFPGHEDVQMVDSELGPIPDGWDVSRLGTVLTLRYGKSLPAKMRVPGDVPVVSSAGVIGSHRESLVSGPGIVVGRKGNVGSVWWVGSDFFPIDTTYYVDTELPLGYVYWKLQDLPFVDSHAAVPGLSREQASALPLAVPPLALLTRFDEMNQATTEECEALRATTRALAATRDLLLPRLVTGRLDISEVDLGVLTPAEVE